MLFVVLFVHICHHFPPIQYDIAGNTGKVETWSTGEMVTVGVNTPYNQCRVPFKLSSYLPRDTWQYPMQNESRTRNCRPAQLRQVLCRFYFTWLTGDVHTVPASKFLSNCQLMGVAAQAGGTAAGFLQVRQPARSLSGSRDGAVGMTGGCFEKSVARGNCRCFHMTIGESLRSLHAQVRVSKLVDISPNDHLYISYIRITGAMYSTDGYV